MAIQKEYRTVVFGKEVIFEEAYYKVSHLHASHEDINVFVEIYSDSTKQHKLDIISHNFSSLTNSGIDLIQVAYSLMKELSDYLGSVDVFEEGQPE